MHYREDYGIETRIVRFHNIFGPLGTWEGGREKAPAALCRQDRDCQVNRVIAKSRYGETANRRDRFALSMIVSKGSFKLMQSELCGAA